MLRRDEYGIKEVRLGGAPLTRAVFDERHGSHAVQRWTVIADEGEVPHAVCWTCMILAIERLDPTAPIPVLIPEPAAVTADASSAAKPTKGSRA